MRIESAASTARMGVQPPAMACQLALPCTGPKPMSTIFPSTTKDATFDPEAMNAARRDRRALISVGRPKVKWRGGDFERETNQRHDDAGREQRLRLVRRSRRWAIEASAVVPVRP